MTMGQVNMTPFIANMIKNLDFEMMKNIVNERGISPAQGPIKGFENGMNMLTLMQNDLKDIFMVMEDDLRGKFEQPAIADDHGLKMNGRRYKKLVITPLLMDFSPVPQVTAKTYYPLAKKNILNSINEYSFAISQYYKERPDGLLYILPFLGINPLVYSYNELEKILSESFDYIRLGWQKFNVKQSSFFTWITSQITPKKMFAGIKVYPSMGFDPWPDDPSERKKNRMFFKFCQELQIPITTHCNPGGFVLIDAVSARKYCSPARWAMVLREYPELRINFAHIGYKASISHTLKKMREGFLGIKENSWTNQIFDLIEKYPNVYSDFSYNGVNPQFYPKLLDMINALNSKQKDIVLERLIFGTDFMINLYNVKSYKTYYDIFDSSIISKDLRHKFSSENPKKFLKISN